MKQIIDEIVDYDGVVVPNGCCCCFDGAAAVAYGLRLLLPAEAVANKVSFELLFLLLLRLLLSSWRTDYEPASIIFHGLLLLSSYLYKWTNEILESPTSP